MTSFEANPFKVVRDFERAVAEYAGSRYAVSVNSCTNALFLCMKYRQHKNCTPEHNKVYIPKFTYLSVPMQIIHAGFKPHFLDNDWQHKGFYELWPLNVYDSARLFTSSMFTANFNSSALVCCSHHWNKTLGIQQGGTILTNDLYAAEWLRKARFDGRTEGAHPTVDRELMVGWHMYMSPEVAAEGLVRLHHLKADNPPMPWDNYPDLSGLEIFK